MGQVTVFSGPERRRRWSDEERRLILAEASSPEACVAQVARCFDRVGLHVGDASSLRWGARRMLLPCLLQASLRRRLSRTAKASRRIAMML